MCVGHAHPVYRRVPEVKFNQYGRCVSDDPRIVARFDGHDLWSRHFEDAAVSILDADLAAHKKPHMCVHAEIGADDRLYVSGPAKSARIDHPLHPRRADANSIDIDPADFAVLSAGDRG